MFVYISIYISICLGDVLPCNPMVLPLEVAALRSWILIVSPLDMLPMDDLTAQIKKL